MELRPPRLRRPGCVPPPLGFPRLVRSRRRRGDHGSGARSPRRPAPVEAAHAGSLLHVFWISEGAGAYAEEHERLRRLLARGGLPDQSRAELLVRLSDVSGKLGLVEACEAADREALALAEPGTDPHWLAVVGLAFHAVHRGDTKEAVRLGRQALEEAETLDDASRISAISNLAGI